MLDPINCEHCGKLFTPKRTTRRFCTNSCRTTNHNAKVKILTKSKKKALKTYGKTQPALEFVSSVSPSTVAKKANSLTSKASSDNPVRQPSSSVKTASQESAHLTALREWLSAAESTQAKVETSHSVKKGQVVAIRNGNPSAWRGAVVGGAVGILGLLLCKNKMKNIQPAVFNMMLTLVFFLAFLGYGIGAIIGRKVDSKTPKSQSIIQESQALEAELVNQNSRVDQFKSQIYTEQMKSVVPTDTTTNSVG